MDVVVTNLNNCIESDLLHRVVDNSVLFRYNNTDYHVKFTHNEFDSCIVEEFVKINLEYLLKERGYILYTLYIIGSKAEFIYHFDSADLGGVQDVTVEVHYGLSLSSECNIAKFDKIPNEKYKRHIYRSVSNRFRDYYESSSILDCFHFEKSDYILSTDKFIISGVYKYIIIGCFDFINTVFVCYKYKYNDYEYYVVFSEGKNRVDLRVKLIVNSLGEVYSCSNVNVSVVDKRMM